MTKPTMTFNYPITKTALTEQASYYTLSPKRMVAADTFIRQVYANGECTVTQSKEAREYANDIVKTGFDLVRTAYLNEFRGTDNVYSDLCYYNLPGEARLLPGYLKKLQKSKLSHPMVTQALALCNELMELASFVEWMKTVTYKSTDRRQQVKVQKEEEQRCKNMTDKVYQAVLPLKQAAEDDADAQTRVQAARIADVLSKNGNDLNKIAPEPGRNVQSWSDTYKRMMGKRAFYLQFCKRIMNRKVEGADLIEVDAARVEELVVRARRDAAAEFESFVAKLNDKINDEVLEATVEAIGGVWFHSNLTVVTKNKGTQVWRTKIITNFSKYGKAFSQFPTRLVK